MLIFIFIILIFPDPTLPTSGVVDCLTIIATDLGYDVSGVSSMPSDGKCVHTPNTIRGVGHQHLEKSHSGTPTKFVDSHISPRKLTQGEGNEDKE